jgi:hypothetical protein
MRQEVLIDAPLELTAAVRLTKDLREAAATLGQLEARFLVKQYYTAQENRISARHQVRKLEEGEMPHRLLSWTGDQFELIELQLKNALDHWTDEQPVGRWLKSIVGVGPCISAGLIAHIEIAKAPAASSLWRFAGLDPSIKWEKGEKRPWNGELKVLTVFKAGESFVKTQNNKNDVYGHIFVVRKAKLVRKNEAHGFAETAKTLLETKKYDKKTDAYKAMIEGKLAKAHIHAMARRSTVKLFLSHVHEVMYWHEYGKVGPAPYPIVHIPELHVHYIDVPNMHMFPGMAEARAKSLREIGKQIGKQIVRVADAEDLAALDDVEDTENIKDVDQ